MLLPRPTDPSEYKKVIEFLNRNLRSQVKWSIDEEYPLALSQTNLKNMTIIEDNEQILAHALTKMVILKSPLGLLKVATIGSVVTDEKHRNKGYSQSILNQCVESAKMQRCDVAILWTNLFDFYRKVGFELVGSEISFYLSKPLPDFENSLKFMSSPNISPEAILKVYSQHTVGSVRNLADIQKSLKIPNSRVYTAWNKAGQLKAYVVEGKGADLTGYIHEWGGMLPDLLPLLKYAQKQTQTPLTLIASHHNKGLIRKMKELGVNHHDGYLGMVKILNAENLISKLNSYAILQKISGFKITEQDAGFKIQCNQEIIEIDNSQDLSRIIFGPEKPSQLIEASLETKETLDKIFPVPFWIWGWDSV
jgi:predicted GNAT family N-acyltransferase